MSMVKAELTRTYKSEPLLVLDGGPFIDAEFSPQRARRIASLLAQLADMAEQQNTHARDWKPVRCEVEA